MLQAAAPVHVGVDNLNVVRHVARLVKGMALVNDGDVTCKRDVGEEETWVD